MMNGAAQEQGTQGRLGLQQPQQSGIHRLQSQLPPAPYAHTLSVPSRWCPAHGKANDGWYLVDYFKVPKERPL